MQKGNPLAPSYISVSDLSLGPYGCYCMRQFKQDLSSSPAVHDPMWGTWHTVALTKFMLFCYNVVSKYPRGKMIIEKHSQSLDAYNSHSNIEKAGVNKTYDRSRKAS